VRLSKKWLYSIFALLLILALAFAMRILNLTILPVFADEAIYIRWSQVMGAEPTLRFLPLSDGKQPLFMWILMFLVTRFQDPLFIGRLLSVFCGMATILGIFVLSLILFKSVKAALVASMVWAFSPFSLFFDRMALVDSMLAMFICWTLVFGVLTAKTRRFDMAMLTGFALGFASLTKSPAIFAAVLLPSVWVLGNFSKKRKKLAVELLYSLFLTLVSYVIALVMYNIQRLGPNFQLLTSRTEDYVFPLSHLWQNPKDPFIFHFDRALQWIWIMGPWAVYLLIAYSLLPIDRRNCKEKLLLIIWFLVPLTVQAMFAKVFTARYILFTLPPLVVLAGSSFVSLKKKKLSGKILILIFGFFVAQALVYDRQLLTNPEKANLPRSERSGYLEEWTAGTGIREVSDFIKKEHFKDPNTKIVVGTEGYFGTLPDGLQMYIQGTPNIVVIGVGLNISEIPESLVESKNAGNKTYLVANSSRLNFKKDFGEYGLKVVASYQKAERPKGIKEYAQYGPRDTFYLFEVN
jgi:4-amino-4-deoxy-L-arabinose transferase-like glycosyltransferase